MTTEKKRAYMKEWREKNIDRLRIQEKAYFKKWRASHLEEDRAYKRRYHWDNRHKILSYQRSKKLSRPEIYENYRLKHKYGITKSDYENLLKKQNGKCAICGERSEKKLHVDHNHETGRVRGLLCHNCNITIGRMKENPDALRSAAEYLEMNTVIEEWRVA